MTEHIHFSSVSVCTLSTESEGKERSTLSIPLQVVQQKGTSPLLTRLIHHFSYRD